MGFHDYLILSFSVIIVLIVLELCLKTFHQPQNLSCDWQFEISGPASPHFKQTPPISTSTINFQNVNWINTSFFHTPGISQILPKINKLLLFLS